MSHDPILTTAQQHVALAGGGIGIVAALIKVGIWARRRLKERKERRNLILEKLGQIEGRLFAMDKQRNAARVIDLAAHAAINEKLDEIILRVNVTTVACGTSLNGLIQIGEAIGKPINGPVVRLHDKLQDLVLEGIDKMPARDVAPEKEGEP